MPEKIKIKGTIVEAEGVKTFTDATGKAISYQSTLVRVGATVFRFKTEPTVGLVGNLDTEVTLIAELKRNKDYTPSLKVVAVEKK